MTIAPVRAQQNSAIDSLRVAFNTTTSDSARILILLEQADIFLYENTGEAEKCISKAIDLATGEGIAELLIKSYHRRADFYYKTSQYEKSINAYRTVLAKARDIDFREGISAALLGLGNAWQRKGDHRKATEYHLENLEFCKAINDSDGVASSFNNLGNIRSDLGDYSGAISYYTQSSDLYEELGDERSSAIVLGNIGMVQNKLKNYDRAIDYFNECNILFRKLDYKPGINFVLKNLGVAFKNKGDLDKALTVYKEALSNYKEADAHHEVSLLHQNIGNVFWEKGKYRSAQAEYRKTLEISEAIGDSTTIAIIENAIGLTYYKLKDIRHAKKHLLRAREIGQRINNPLLLMNTEQALKEVYATGNDFENAFKSLSRYMTFKDSLQSKEKTKLAGELEARFQHERKEKEIALLSSQNELKTLQLARNADERAYLFMFAVVAVVLGLVMYHLYRVKKRSGEKLKEMNRLQSAFFVNISHEFRTPLTLILAGLDDDSKPHDQALLKRNAQRLLQLTNQLLDLSKLEAGKEKLELRPVYVSEFLRVRAISFSSLAENRGIKFIVDIEQFSDQSYIDPDKIEKIVFNLLSNAFKFTEEGGEVVIRCKVNPVRLIIEISDTGIGIPQEALNHIFHRFYQVDSADNRNHGGTGVGLALTKELVSLHHGRIKVDSALYRGTTFTVSIPLQGYDRKQMEVADNQNKPRATATLPAVYFDSAPDKTAWGDKHEHEQHDFVILIVEDNVDLRAYLAESLHQDYTILQAESGHAGFDLALVNIPDLIISDLMMPGLDGQAMCRKIRANEKTAHIPFIMLTAKSDRESKLEGLETGADDYLVKPFDVKELQIKIRNIFEQRQRVQAHIKNKFFLPASGLSANERFINKASEIVYANLSNADFTVESFQKEMGYSRMQLHRKIKAITGQSATEFIRLIRLKHAAMLLEKGYDQVAQIAYEAGFSSPSYFTRCFKETYGVTPSGYVEKITAQVKN